MKQDQVNSANSAFIFMINLLFIQGCQSDSVGRGGQLVRLVRLVRLVWCSRGTPTGSQGVKGYASRVPGGQGVGLQGPKGSRGRPGGSQGVQG